MKSKKIIMILIILSMIVVDQIIKYCLINVNIEVIKDIFSFSYIKNTGIAFGMTLNMLLIIITNIILITVLFIILLKNKFHNFINTGIMFIIIGGTSNLIDRIFRGYVIDYINIPILAFPKFNLADIFIVLGIILLISIVFKNLISLSKEDQKVNE